MINFNKHNITNTETKIKARVSYSLNNHVGRFDRNSDKFNKECVTVFCKDLINKGNFTADLLKVCDRFPVINNSDGMTDYFENDHLTLWQGDDLFEAAKAAAVAS